MISKEAQEAIVFELEMAEDFYVPVKKLYKDLSDEGFALPGYESFLEFFKKDTRFEVQYFGTKKPNKKDQDSDEEAGYLGSSGEMVKLRSRKMTKEDMKQITLKHAQNVIENLVKAYEVQPDDLPAEKEDELLELMKKAKQLKEKVDEAFKKK